jgi:hypothetical protein
MQTSLTNTKWATYCKQKSGQHTLARQKIYIKINIYSLLLDTGGYKNAGKSGKEGLFKNGRDVGQDF